MEPSKPTALQRHPPLLASPSRRACPATLLLRRLLTLAPRVRLAPAPHKPSETHSPLHSGGRGARVSRLRSRRSRERGPPAVSSTGRCVSGVHAPQRWDARRCAPLSERPAPAAGARHSCCDARRCSSQPLPAHSHGADRPVPPLRTSLVRLGASRAAGPAPGPEPASQPQHRRPQATPRGSSNALLS